MGISMMKGVFVICCLAVALGSGLAEGRDVVQLESEEASESASVSMAHVRAAGETIALVQEKAKAGPRPFNIFGFFGCCYHCKHNPECTEKCMSKHKIENGSERAAAMSHERLVQAAHTISFMEMAEGEGYHKHKPIKLNIAEGHGKISAAREAPSPVKGGDGHKIASRAADKLRSESTKHNNFRMQGFFHCAFTCDHRTACEKKCLSRHHISMNKVQILEENDRISQDQMQKDFDSFDAELGEDGDNDEE